MSKEILLNAFDMASVGHIAHGMWTHPADRSTSYTDIEYWMELARILERGKFDGIFLADVVGVYDVYKGGPATAVRHAIQLPINDPTLVIPAMAAVTRHLGFGVTANLTYEQPYLFARRMSTLDHLTKGRVAWNIVTGFLDSTARSSGLANQLGHDERYDRADEYMEVVYKLWEASWDDDAVVRDAARHIYAHPDRVRSIGHSGRYFCVDAIHLSEPSPQRTPVLFQAGASERGLAFAARHGECVFVPGGKNGGRDIVADLRRRVVQCGRRAQDILVFGSLQVVVGRTDREARDKYEELRRYAVPEAGLAQFASAIGIDFSEYGPDEPIRYVKNDAIRSLAESITTKSGDGVWTVRRLLESMTLGGRFKPVVGSPESVADEMVRQIEAADLDGFNLIRTVSPGSIVDFIDLVIPVLQERGRYKRDYAAGTLREKLFGRARLAGNHAGATFRVPAASKSETASKDLP
jgi:FMN-dependent oxidoreductase (nitrilotriacetate monooxygenase family)